MVLVSGVVGKDSGQPVVQCGPREQDQSPGRSGQRGQRRRWTYGKWQLSACLTQGRLTQQSVSGGLVAAMLPLPSLVAGGMVLANI